MEWKGIDWGKEAGWINVEDEKAPFNMAVEVLYKNGRVGVDRMVSVGSYSVHWFGVTYEDDPEPTHWRPLPLRKN